MKLLPFVIACLAAVQLGGCLGAPRPTAARFEPETAGPPVRVPTTLTSSAGGASTLILGVQ